jgi:hypothetical protein
MNGLRRAFLVLYSLILIAAAGGLIALVWNQDRKLDLNVGDFNLQAFATSTNSAKWMITVILAAIALIAFCSLIIAVMRTGQGGRSRGTLRMRQADGGTVEVTGAAIESLLRDELERLPEVRSVDPRVRLNGGAVDTSLDAVIEPSASIAQVTNLLGQGVASVLREQVGVTNIRRPSIRITYDEMNARPAGAVPRPQQPPVSTQPLISSAPPTQAERDSWKEDDRPRNE